MELIDFEYSNDYTGIKETKPANVSYIYVPYLYSDEIRHIKTVNDLSNMENGYYYKLINDIDLSGVNWTAKTFNGVLDGNNHTIRNLNLVRTYQENGTPVNQGLFAKLEGAYIKDLYLDNFMFVVENYSKNSSEFGMGALAGDSRYSQIHNVHVNADITYNTIENRWQDRVGIVVGYVYNSSLSKISAKGNLSSNGHSGGIIGYGEYITLTNAISYVNIAGTSFYQQGIIAGTIQNSSLSKVISLGMIEGGYGFVMGYSNTTVSNSISLSRNEDGNPAYVNSNEYWTNNYTTFQTNEKGFSTATEDFILNIIKDTFDSNIWYIEESTPKIKVIPRADVTNLETLEYGMSFELDLNDPEDVSELINVEIYQGNLLIKTLEDLNIREVTGLKYSSTYILVVTYHYSFSDGIENELVVRQSFMTKDKENIPTVNIKNAVSTTTEIEFAVETVDILNIGEIESVNLYLNSVLVSSLGDFDELMFESLLSNALYTIEVVYAYDFNDGFGLGHVKANYNIRTKAKIVPELDVEISTTKDTLEYNVKFNDIDNTTTFNKVELFKDKLLIDSSNNINHIFDNLELYSTYEVRVYYSYDLNDGNSTRNIVETRTMKTNPHIEITDLNIINSTGIMIGDKVIFEVLLDNPNNIQITHVTINDVIYEVNTANQNSIEVHMDIDSSFEGGETEFVLKNFTW